MLNQSINQCLPRWANTVLVPVRSADICLVLSVHIFQCPAVFHVLGREWFDNITARKLPLSPLFVPSSHKLLCRSTAHWVTASAIIISNIVAKFNEAELRTRDRRLSVIMLRLQHYSEKNFSWQANKIVCWKVRQWSHVVDERCSLSLTATYNINRPVELMCY